MHREEGILGLANAKTQSRIFLPEGSQARGYGIFSLLATPRTRKSRRYAKPHTYRRWHALQTWPFASECVPFLIPWLSRPLIAPRSTRESTARRVWGTCVRQSWADGQSAWRVSRLIRCRRYRRQLLEGLLYRHSITGNAAFTFSCPYIALSLVVLYVGRAVTWRSLPPRLLDARVKCRGYWSHHPSLASFWSTLPRVGRARRVALSTSART